MKYKGGTTRDKGPGEKARDEKYHRSHDVDGRRAGREDPCGRGAGGAAPDRCARTVLGLAAPRRLSLAEIVGVLGNRVDGAACPVRQCRHLVSFVGRGRKPLLAMDRRLLARGRRGPAAGAVRREPSGLCVQFGRLPGTQGSHGAGEDRRRRPPATENRQPRARVEGSPAPYQGRYPCGSLVHNGVWYYGTYALTNGKSGCGGVGWTLLGPLVGFRWSTDLGKTWSETPCTPAKPLFGEDPQRSPVKIGAPHFVDFGRNMEHSPTARPIWSPTARRGPRRGTTGFRAIRSICCASSLRSRR